MSKVERWARSGPDVFAQAMRERPLTSEEMKLLIWVNNFRRHKLAEGARILTEIGGTPLQLEDW